MKAATRLVLANVIALQLLAGLAGAGGRWRILGVPLDMPVEDELDGQYLEGLYEDDYGANMPHNYGGYIAGHLKDSLLRELPFYHMNSTMKDGRQLELWFSTKADGRKTFGVELHEVFDGKQAKDPAAANTEAEAAFGKPDRVIASPAVPGQTILLFVDTNLPKDKRDAVIARLPQVQQMAQEDVDKFSRTDLRERVRILGPDFRGAVVSFYSYKGKVKGSDVELLDLMRARTVFNLERER
jgi:hypothetical protein